MENTREVIIKQQDELFYKASAYLYIDGENQGKLPNGKTGAIDIDFTSHKIMVVYNDGYKNYPSNVCIVPANDLSYQYIFVADVGFFKTNITLNEDMNITNRNNKILADRKVFYDIKSKVDSVFKKIQDEENPLHGRNYELVNTLPDYCLNSKYYKDFVSKLGAAIYKSLADSYFGEGLSMDVCYQGIRDVANMLRVDKNKFPSTAHYDYMIIKNNLINSVLSENTIEDLNAIINREALDKSLPQEVFLANNDAEELYKKGKYMASINRILYIEFPDETLDMMKKWLIFAATIEGNDDEATQLYDMISYMNKKAFGRYAHEGKIVKLQMNVDMLIAEALRLSRTRSFANMNDSLHDFCDITAVIFHVESKQYSILQKVFAHLNAYEQEQIVLESMVKNEIVRSAEQEERLKFLKSRKGNGDIIADTDLTVTKDNSDNKKFTYEYRSLSWSEKEVREYFDSLTMKNQTTELPFVVNEWTKTVNVRGIKWDVKLVSDRIDNVLKETFEEEFHIVIPLSSPTGNISNYDYTILIANTDLNGHNWIGFQVSGEQILKNQITLSVYTMYMTITDQLSENIIERNKDICNKVLLMKQKQNPKINTYIQTVTDVLIKELESWINSQTESNIYN